MAYVEVALPVPLFRTFTYKVPDEIAAPIAPGSRVVVPFTNRREIGIVLGDTEAPEGVKLRNIIAVADSVASLTAPLIDTAEWIARWYAAPIGVVLRSMLPAMLATVSRPAPTAQTRKSVRIKGELPSLLMREKLFKRAPQQRKVYELLEAHGGAAGLTELLEQAGCTRGVITAMSARGIVELADEPVMRDPFSSRAVSAPPERATEAQRSVVDSILKGKSGDAFLLHGITGSGKTFVYIEVLREIVQRRGRSAIVLVPEIALTPQTVDRFRGAFGDDVAVLHSGLSDGERLDAWRTLRSGERRIAVGARSALFAPLENVGVVIVDEEHDASYKQSETPRYHARETAVMRARHEGAIVVLGSATPALESMHRAMQGAMTLLRLPDRIAGASLPPVYAIDMRSRENGGAHVSDADRFVLSQRLADAIDTRLAKQEQTLLLLNRRGFSAFVQCTACGSPVTCPNCSISLTYHRVPDVLICHYCRYQSEVPERCQQCGSASLRRVGLGTQRVEKVVGELFPGARIARMDVDTTSGKWAHATILDKVANGEVDILLGTQMVSKGLDFPNVTLVGVIDADIGLNMPDFRASERTFQLLSQVAGRAGRGPRGGEVLIQTRMPEHHAVRFALGHDYDGFVEYELKGRTEPQYPPFVSIANVVVSGEDANAVAAGCIEAADWTRGLIEAAGEGGVMLLGPSPCAVGRIKRRYRWHFLLKADRASMLSRMACYVAERCPVAKAPGLRLTVDRDPVSLL